ncbi:MAG: DUF393 domain-containing protein [Pseudomonadota bacterium]
MQADASKLRIYHDRSCPICRAEMEELKYLDADGRLELVDCSVADFSDTDTRDAGLAREDLMSALHVLDGDGQWHQGPDAFALVYASLGIERMAALWGRGPWRPVVNLGYRLFAISRRFLALLGFEHVVRWMIRREARAAAERADACQTKR